jgi:hypothetical protein
MIVGTTRSFGEGYDDVWVLKIDMNGDTLWTQTFGGSSNDNGNAIKYSAPNRFTIAGSTLSYGAGWYDGYIVNIDEKGNEIQSITHGSTGTDAFRSILINDKGEMIATGYTDSFGNGETDIWVIKMDSNGNY